MSRTVAAFTILLLPSALLAESAADHPVPAEQAMARYLALTSQAEARCRQASRTGDDIIVCGRAGRSPRLPLAPDTLRERLARDGARSGTDALARLAPPVPSCSDPEAGYHCQGGLDFFAIGRFLYKLTGAVIDPDN